MPGCPQIGVLVLQDIEANLLKQDIAKAKQKEQTDQPAAVAKALELNDAAAMRRRGRMMLPAPQVMHTPAGTILCAAALQRFEDCKRQLHACSALRWMFCIAGDRPGAGGDSQG